MQYLIISDIHANMEALEAVLADAEGRYQQILNCGDLVGYGPDPNAVVDWCREHSQSTVRGNHDKASVNLENLSWFNPVAQESARWTHEQLTPANREYLEELAQGPLYVDNFQIVHGSPTDEDEYLVNVEEVEYVANFLSRSLSFFGHTHIQGGFFVHRNGVKRITNTEIWMEETAAYLINPGSVGQPRDHDSRAAYALYNPSERVVQLCRVEYDVSKTMEKILKAGLPAPLATRLWSGY